MLTLLFPALMHQQQMALRTACEQNLMRLGNALAHYANANNQTYPPIAASGNRSAAGIVIPTLFDGGYLDDPSIVLCPASPEAAERAGQCPPTLDQIDRAAGKQLAQLQNRMGGSYGYLMGHMVDRRFQMPRYQSRAYFPIISDAPSGSQPGLASTNHGCRGQNVLFEDNHVRFVSGCLANGRDQIFLNNLGLVAAGVNPEDVVIGRSGASPTVLVPTAGQ
jgi:hypothetical protein